MQSSSLFDANRGVHSGCIRCNDRGAVALSNRVNGPAAEPVVAVGITTRSCKSSCIADTTTDNNTRLRSLACAREEGVQGRIRCGCMRHDPRKDGFSSL